MNKISLFISVLMRIATSITCLQADAVITLYLKQPPEAVLDQIRKSGTQITKKDLPEVSGFYSLYGGYSDYSNKDGLISFPLRHVTPKLYVVITPKIKLEIIKKQTVSHLEINENDENKQINSPLTASINAQTESQPSSTPKTFSVLTLTDKAPVKIYSFEKREEEKNNLKFIYWQVKEETIPQDKRINAISLVILTHPSNLYVPLQEQITSDTPQMVLPAIYVIGSQGKNHINLEALDKKRYFEPIDMQHQKADEIKNQNMITNE